MRCESSEKGRFLRVFRLKNLHNVAKNNIMQPLHKNENLLFKDFQNFLLQSSISLKIVSRTIFAG